MTGIERIAVERRRQVEQEGWTPEHDDNHEKGALGMAAACYAAPFRIFLLSGFSAEVEGNRVEMVHDAWPWEAAWDKRRKHSRLRQLEIAGALIAAEIDRLLRENGSGTE